MSKKRRNIFRHSIWTGRGNPDPAPKPVDPKTLKALMERQWQHPGVHRANQRCKWIVPGMSGGWLLPGSKE